MKHIIHVDTPPAGWCFVMPDAHTDKVKIVWIDSDSDSPEDVLATNLAAQWLLREGWVEFAGGTIDLNNESVITLIEEIP